jgi:cytochrome c oxidase subunit 2
VVEEPAAFDAWLAKQQTFAMTQAKAAAPPVAAAGAGPGAGLAEQGRALAQSKGCAGCHSIDGSPGVGPTWKGLFGKTETFADGSSAPVDAAFLKKEITDPQARLVKGFGPVMPKIALTDEEIAALTAYIQANGSGAEAAPQAAAGAVAAGVPAAPSAVPSAAEAGTYTTSTATGVPPSASPPAPAQAGATK